MFTLIKKRAVEVRRLGEKYLGDCQCFTLAGMAIQNYVPRFDRFVRELGSLPVNKLSLRRIFSSLSSSPMDKGRDPSSQFESKSRRVSPDDKKPISSGILPLALLFANQKYRSSNNCNRKKSNIGEFENDMCESDNPCFPSPPPRSRVTTGSTLRPEKTYKVLEL